MVELNAADTELICGDELDLDKNLKNLIEKKTLKWIFVGGKGGVGKTTTSASIAVEMSKHRESVLIISTDPAHNLGDTFNQEFTSEPTQIKMRPNLFGMEVDPEANEGSGSFFQKAMGGNPLFGGKQKLEGDYGEEEEQEEESGGDFMSEFMKAMPGIDEASAFGEVLNQIDKYNYDLVIFDTAPTGHTMRLLKFPQICENGLKKLIELKEKFGGMLKQAQAMMAEQGHNPEGVEDKLFESLNTLKARIEKVNKQFQDDDFTTFVAVCIPEKLSVYETSRLMEELAKQDIDLSNIVVNQVCTPDPTKGCEQCLARRSMQDKYLKQIEDIFNLHHVVHVPQGRAEVIGEDLLIQFGSIIFGDATEWPGYKC